jgi:hypothetical protein
MPDVQVHWGKKPEPGSRIVTPSFWPRDYQRDLMKWFDRGGLRGVAVWPRREGKDMTSGAIICREAHKRVGAYWWAFPTYAQAKKAIWDGFTRDGRRILDVLFPRAMLARDPNNTEMMLHLLNGSTVQLVGTDTIDRLVGAGPRGVVFSEFALSHPGAWDFVRPMLRERHGWALFQSTPRGENHLYELLQVAKKRPDWFWQHFDSFALHPEAHDAQCPVCLGEGAAGVEKMLAEERETGMPEALIRQEYLCDFTAANVGSVFGDLVEKLQQAGRVCSFEHSLNDVMCSFDLGHADATFVWFWRWKGNGIDVLDCYGNSGKPIEFYKDWLWDQPYAHQANEYARIWLPHDARAKNLVTGTSVVESFLGDPRFTDRVAITPELSLADGIQAGRAALMMPGTRIHTACNAKTPLGYSGLQALRAYHYEFDEEKKVLGKKPNHDWSSHAADAWRYVGVVAKVGGLAVPVREPPKPLGITLDDLESLGRSNRGRM